MDFFFSASLTLSWSRVAALGLRSWSDGPLRKLRASLWCLLSTRFSCNRTPAPLSTDLVILHQKYFLHYQVPKCTPPLMCKTDIYNRFLFLFLLTMHIWGSGTFTISELVGKGEDSSASWKESHWNLHGLLTTLLYKILINHWFKVNIKWHSKPILLL